MTHDVDELTLDEKASLTSGAGFWTTQPIPRAGIPSIMLTDGPHGLRKQAGEADHLGLAASVPATCFPPAVALASSWDPALAQRVGTALKHFAANNQETDRMRASSDIDPRPLREIYLRAFQHIVEHTQPWTVMCSYNRLNGVYCSQDPWLLTDVLRGEWGFEGLVVSDWGAVDDRVAGLAAGLDLEMPSSDGRTDAQVVAAVRAGRLDVAHLDTAASRVLDLVRKAQKRPAVPGSFDVDAHHSLAREPAARSVVLLKNEIHPDTGPVLPLRPAASVAVIGEFARTPRYQGAGSSQIIPTRLDNALDAIRAKVHGEVTFAAGFTLDGSGGTEALRDGAVDVAAAASVAVLFLGLPTGDESEGYDREHIDLPEAQLALVDAVRRANPRTVVVLSHGGVVALPFAAQVPAIVEGWLLGQAGGSWTADVLFGAVNPGGKLTETIPLRLEDTPAFVNFPGEFGHVRYGEGMLIGYRWYDARKLDAAFPFGHGPSYTTFAYGDAMASVDENGDIRVAIPVTNTGAVRGRETVQAYTSLSSSIVQRPPRELKAFDVVELDPDETRTIELVVRLRDLAYWDVRVDGWIVEGGEYVIDVGSSSRDLRSRTSVVLAGDDIDLPLTMSSTIDEVLAHPTAGPLLRTAIDSKFDAHFLKMIGPNPVGRLDGLPLALDEMQRLITDASA